MNGPCNRWKESTVQVKDEEWLARLQSCWGRMRWVQSM